MPTSSHVCPDHLACPNPSGRCHCGCGRETRIAGKTSARDGHVRGCPVRFVRGHGNLRKNPIGYAVEGRCWVFQGTLDKDGYGLMTVGGNSSGAHRWFYERRFGPIPPGMQLDHLCRNRACVNPAHLDPVSAAVNVQRSMLAKLTPGAVVEIRRLLDDGVPAARVADRFSVGRTTVTHIKHRRTWKNVA